MDLNRGLRGETPLDDYSGLKLPHVKTIAQLNEAEFANINKAVVKYLSRRPTARMASFASAWMLRLHREMFGDVWSWAGEPRTVPLNIGVPAYRIVSDLEQLAGDVDYWRHHDGPDLIEQSALVHYRAVHIHPFLNGNGRWARLLANIWLRHHDHPLTMWPEQDMVAATSSIRREYIGALQEADRGDPSGLIELQRRFTVGGRQ